MDAQNIMVNGQIMRALVGQRVSALGLVISQTDSQAYRIRLADNEEVVATLPIGTVVGRYVALNMGILLLYDV